MRYLCFVFLSFNVCTVSAQSFELMPGTERVFIDAQYLEFFVASKRWSLFSRARATSEYTESNSNLFTGAYLNYTSASGIGATVLGRISSNSSGIDAGIHFFKARKSFMIFALASINVNDKLWYSWFSMMRYTPPLNQKLKLYSSLELFSAFGSIGHLASVQRIRLGIDLSKFQFGLAINLNESRLNNFDSNPGLFLRKQF